MSSNVFETLTILSDPPLDSEKKSHMAACDMQRDFPILVKIAERITQSLHDNVIRLFSILPPIGEKEQ